MICWKFEHVASSWNLVIILLSISIARLCSDEASGLGIVRSISAALPSLYRELSPCLPSGKTEVGSSQAFDTRTFPEIIFRNYI